jgi:hypothetical protein
MKVFCVGLNKTGTTSLGHFLRQLGLRVGDQPAGEMLLEEWSRRDFSRISALAQTADAFQDIPFSLPFTYQAMDLAFPGSKFILSVRDSGEQRYASLTRFHTAIVGKGRLPTGDDLRAFPYRYRGFLWRYHELVHGATDATVYDRARYQQHYDRHNAAVREYFRFRSHDLLDVNLRDPDAAVRVCALLGVEYTGLQMPVLNQS